ncbi:MAG: DNA polymerase III subunit epsilon [Gammaproteobacteria bacterium PRO9]|nr:DNA polymerase III subunit epsilon [Gammaproteobacteria bacterium PRO9]
MRQIVLDTETTGLEVEKGHRIIEIGCVELVNRRRTNRNLHHYLQPDREIDPGAQEVHGITAGMLAGKPRFADIGAEFLEFVAGAELIIHNADFDLAFLNAEIGRAGLWPADKPPPVRLSALCTVVDSLTLARRLHPGQRNSLDALCRRYSIDNTGRDLHGALLDAQLLADVYLAMTGGQATLLLDDAAGQPGSRRAKATPVVRDGLRLKVIRATADELAEHERQLELLDKKSGGKTLWRRHPTAGRSS